MLRVLTLSLAVILGAVSMAPPATAFTETEEERIRELVRDYILDNPEIIAEAITLLREKEEQAQAQRRAAALRASADVLFNDPADPVLGNPEGDVAVVEFFDYRCGFCKRVVPAIQEVVEGDPQVRFVMKEFPILGPESVVASRLALASHAQGRYAEYHEALMGHRGDFDEETLLQLAASLGLDADKLAADARTPEIDQHLSRVQALARTLGISGTPAFIIGETIVPGAVGADDLRSLIAEARQP